MLIKVSNLVSINFTSARLSRTASGGIRRSFPHRPEAGLFRSGPKQGRQAMPEAAHRTRHGVFPSGDRFPNGHGRYPQRKDSRRSCRDGRQTAFAPRLRSEVIAPSRDGERIARYLLFSSCSCLSISFTFSIVACISSRARSIFARTSATRASAFFDLAKNPMLFSSRPISCSSWRTLL